MTTKTTHTEQNIPGEDSTSLHIQRWQPDDDVRAEVLIVHGYADHGRRYRNFAHSLASHGIASTAVDLRGHGFSGGQRGYVRRFADYFGDVRTALNTLPTNRPRFIFAHSNGALIVLDWLRGEPQTTPPIAGLVLSSPFLEVGMQVPEWKLKISRFASRYLPRMALPSGVDASVISRDLTVVKAYASDPKVFKIATAAWHSEATAAQSRVRAMKSMPLPLFYAYSDSDLLALPAANNQLAVNLHSPDKVVRVVPGAYHEIINEADAQPLHNAIAEWIIAHGDAVGAHATGA